MRTALAWTAVAVLATGVGVWMAGPAAAQLGPPAANTRLAAPPATGARSARVRSARSEVAGSRSSGAGTRIATRPMCTTPLGPQRYRCLALVRTDVTRHTVAPHAAPDGFGPADLQSAYRLPATTAGAGQTVALIEAGDQINLEADLATYRRQYGLSPCTTANGCFRKTNDQGQNSPLPPGDPDWGGETSLDVDMVAAVCPNCHILVVETGGPGGLSFDNAVNTAVRLGARFVSNSYGGGESSDEINEDNAAFNHPGVVITASTGDDGFGVSIPAAYRYVVATGGTSLTRGGGARGWTETAWTGAGSGCSAYLPKQAWQHDTGCPRRTVADVSAIADPATGVAYYDSYGQSGWDVAGGTSVSAPVIAAAYALAGTPPAGSYPAPFLYAHADGLNDVTAGSNGSCSPAYLCRAGTGYDGPTGLGTPNGITAFGGGAAPPPPPPGGGGGPVTGIGGKCLTAGGGSAGAAAVIATCAGSAAQTWTVGSDGTVRALGLCLDVTGSGTANLTPVQLWDCNGSGAQGWRPQGGELVNPASGRCLDDPGSRTADGTQLIIYTCKGSANQLWHLPG